MSNNKIKLVVEVDEYCRDAIIRHINGTYGAQLPYYIISSAFEAIANGTSITEGDLIMFRTLMTEIANKGLPFEEVLLLIDNAKTPTEGDCISRSVLDEIRQLYKDYQPNLATEVIEFGDALEKLIDNAQTVSIKSCRECPFVADEEKQITNGDAWKSYCEGQEVGFKKAEDVFERMKLIQETVNCIRNTFKLDTESDKLVRNCMALVQNAIDGEYHDMEEVDVSEIEKTQGKCEKCDFRKFSEQFIDGVVDVMNKNGITSVDQLNKILKGGADNEKADK